MDEDRELIERTLGGDSAAFGCLVRKYQDRLHTTLVHFLGGAEDAQDVCQDAFLQAYTNLRSFQQQAAFYTWLYRIARNLAVSSHRRRKLRQHVPLDSNSDGAAHDPADPHAGPESRLERTERAQQIRRCLQALSEEHREVLVLKEIEEFEYEQIAAALEIPIGTVRSRLFRARMQLKELLQEVVQEDVRS